MKTNSDQKFGFTLVEIMIVVAIVGLLAAIAIPNLEKARITSQRNVCVGNLKKISIAKIEWSAARNGTNTIAPTLKDLGLSNLECPAGGAYTVGDKGLPTCSILASSSIFGVDHKLPER